MKKLSYRKFLQRMLLNDESGSVIVLWAISISAVIGMIGLGVETGNWYLNKRNMQAAADAAAIGAAYQGTLDARTSSAVTEAARNGFSSGAGGGITVTVNNPPTTGSYTSNNNAVEVIITQQQNNMLSGIFMQTKPTVKARSVAIRNTAGTACVLALNSVSADTVLENGNAVLNMPNCMVAANSTNNSAISVSGSSVMNVQGLYTPGGYSVNGNATFTSATTPVTDGTPLTDPYATLAMPAPGACTYNNYSTNNTVTINPGTYCNGFKLNANARVTMNPGTYIIDRGTFDINGQAQLTGNGVTIILTSSTGSDYAKVTINGGATVTLTAPSSGTYKGIAFYQNRNASVNNDSQFNGGSTMKLNGAMYFPKGHLVFNGGNSTGASPCTQIVSYTVTFNGNSNIANNCTANDTTPITVPGAVTLEE